MFRSQINSFFVFLQPHSGRQRLLSPSVLSVDSFVLAVLGHLHQLVDGVQQAVAVLPQQPLVEPLVSEAHLQQHCHQGRVLSGSGVDASLY